MGKIKVGHAEYDMPEVFTFREMRLVKRMTGCASGEIWDALGKGDTDVIAAFALVAVMRADKSVTEDDLLDMTIDQIEFLEDEPGVNGDGPPEGPAETPETDTDS